jgi:hypothetical protein
MSYDPSFRPASSLYSEPSPAAVDTRYARNGYETTPETTYTTDEEVSPPSSPEIGGTRYVRIILHEDFFPFFTAVLASDKFGRFS